MLHKTSMRGRPSSSRGINSYRATRPVFSLTDRAPSKAKTMATDSPLVLMASRPQRLTETVSGNCPSFSCRCLAMISLATSLPRMNAALDGMRYGSNACIFLPVGKTPGPSRSKSPPAAGWTQSPFNALTKPTSNSSLLRCKRLLIVIASESFSEYAVGISNCLSSCFLIAASSRESLCSSSSSSACPAARDISSACSNVVEATTCFSNAVNSSPKYASK